MRTLLFALILSFTGNAAPADAARGRIELHVLRPGFPIPDSRDSQRREQESVYFDPIELTLLGGEQSSSVRGMKFEGHAVQLGAVLFRQHYREVKLRLKKRIVVDVPTTRMVRREKKIFGRRIVYDEPVVEMRRQENTVVTDLASSRDTSLTLVSRHPIAIPLPDRIPLLLSPTRDGGEIRVADRELVRRFLVEKALGFLSDVQFDRNFLLATENLPLGDLGGQILDRLRPKGIAELRKLVERELSRPAFLDHFMGTLAKKFEGFPLPSRDPMPLVASQEPSGWVVRLAEVPAGAGDTCEPSAGSPPNSGLVLVDNEGLGSLLARFLRATPVYRPRSDRESRELARFFSCSPLSSISVRLGEGQAPEVVLWTKDERQFVDFRVRLHLIAVDGTETDTAWTFIFEAGREGWVRLETVKEEKSGDAIAGRLFPRQLGARLKMLFLKSLVNEKLATQIPAQTDPTGAPVPKVHIALVGDDGPTADGEGRRAKLLRIEFPFK